MTHFRCPTCGEPHNLEQIEPAFSRPDALLLIPAAEREGRARQSDEGCILVSEDGTTLSYFIRTVLPVTIRAEPRPIRWGVWAEVDQHTYLTIAEHFDDAEQALLGPYPATLANRLPHYPETLGLQGVVQPTTSTTRPEFRLSPTSDHPFVREVTVGVLPERALEWRLWSVHPPV